MGWAIYLVIIAGAILLGPRIMALALDSQYPMAAVSGNSMWPALKQGDMVFLEGVSSVDELKLRDIIAFRHTRGMAIHRIVSIEGGEITTRGDANFREDPPVTIEDVIGKVPTVAGRPAKIPYLGYVSFVLGPLTRHTDDVAAPSQAPAASDGDSGTAYGTTEP